MNIKTVESRIELAFSKFDEMIREGHWTLAHAHDVLMNKAGLDSLDLFDHAALAKAIAVHQCDDVDDNEHCLAGCDTEHA